MATTRMTRQWASRDAEAARAYDAAIAGTGNAAERDFLRRRHEVLTGGG
jgi:RNA polymerase sigma-70 factor, ECF subfamily